MLRAAALLARRGAQASSSSAGYALLARQFATEASVPAGILSGVPGKYALALHQAATKASVADKVEKELAEVMDMATTNEQFGLFLRDPSISALDKDAALKEVLTKAGVNDITKNFVSLLVENRRVNIMDKIVGQYKDLMSHLRGEVKAIVTTAEPMNDEELANVRKGVMDMLSKGQKLLLEQKVDPTIIGGVILDVGDKHIDMSILSRVKRVQQLILDSQLA